MSDAGNERPWYRHAYVWLVAAIPAVAVIGGITTYAIAMATFDGLVEDDYYRRGLEINQVLVREQNAAARGLTAEVDFNQETGVFTINLGSKRGELPRALDVAFLHATRAGLDRRLEVPRRSAGTYVGRAPNLEAGRWHVHIEADDWRLREIIAVDLPRQRPH
jgi:hypothetical protein